MFCTNKTNFKTETLACIGLVEFEIASLTGSVKKVISKKNKKQKQNM